MYILISVCEREIETSYYDSLESAQAQMHKEMIEAGAPEDIFVNDGEMYYFEPEADYGYGTYCGWVSDGNNHDNYDWLIELQPLYPN